MIYKFASGSFPQARERKEKALYFLEMLQRLFTSSTLDYAGFLA